MASDDPIARTDAYLAMASGGCRWPVQLRLHSGEEIVVPCKSQRTTRCPACARRARQRHYRRVLAGIEAVTANDLVLWVTLTPPGAEVFGCPSHVQTHGSRGQMIAACPCKRPHHPRDALIGTPLDPSRFRYDLAATWNASVSRLWSQTMHRLRSELGLPRNRYGDVSYMRVFEWQQRGLIHVHALVRITNARGVRHSRRALVRAIKSTVVMSSDDAPTPIAWGARRHVRRLLSGGGSDGPSRRASYVAKYATKHPADDLERRSAPRARHYALIAREAQARASGCKSTRAIIRLRSRLGLDGPVVSASRNWEPKTHDDNRAQVSESAGRQGRRVSVGYLGDLPDMVQRELDALGDRSDVDFESECARVGVTLREPHLDANDGVESFGVEDRAAGERR